jgi:hypothetical protein
MRIYSVLYLQVVLEIQHRELLVQSDLLPPDSRYTILCVYSYTGAAIFGFLKKMNSFALHWYVFWKIVFLSGVGLTGTRKVKATHTTAKHLAVMIFKFVSKRRQILKKVFINHLW